MALPKGVKGLIKLELLLSDRSFESCSSLLARKLPVLAIKAILEFLAILSMTIFGFNTDVKHGETVYHVESEARVSDLLVQTSVFVKGRCVGKRTTSYAQEASRPGFSDQVIHQLLKAQHRGVLESIGAGAMKSGLGTVGEVQDIGTSGLSLKWIKADTVGSRNHITLHFQVTDSGAAVAGAEVVSRIGNDSDAPVIARSNSDISGNVQMQIAIMEKLRREAAIIVQATHAGKSVTRKFRLKMTEKESGDRT